MKTSVEIPVKTKSKGSVVLDYNMWPGYDRGVYSCGTTACNMTFILISNSVKVDLFVNFTVNARHIKELNVSLSLK